MIDIRGALAKLAKLRPLFHAEADFQHALAWQIKEMYPNSAIRLEFRHLAFKEKAYLDAWLTLDGDHVALELKYKTKPLIENVGGEHFELLNQGAQPLGRYDFLKDVERIEHVVSSTDHISGFAILLTNDPGYWNQAGRPNTVDASFRLNEGRTVTGKLSWSSRASAGTMKGREEPLRIRGAYDLNWEDYSKDGAFRMLILEVARPPVVE